MGLTILKNNVSKLPSSFCDNNQLLPQSIMRSSETQSYAKSNKIMVLCGLGKAAERKYFY